MGLVIKDYTEASWLKKTLLSRVLLTFSDMTCSLASVWMASMTSDPPYCVWLTKSMDGSDCFEYMTANDGQFGDGALYCPISHCWQCQRCLNWRTERSIEESGIIANTCCHGQYLLIEKWVHKNNRWVAWGTFISLGRHHTLTERNQSTVDRHKFNHLATNSTTFAAFSRLLYCM